MAYTAHFPISSFLDVDGKPLENGYVYIGTAGLDPVGNPITVYWDAAATQVAAQPIRTIGGYPSNNGVRSRLYVNAVDYSIKVTNVNGTDTVPVALYNAEDAYAADIIFLQAGSGAVARTVESKLRDTVSVKDFGAVGDGVTNDTSAIQAALDASLAVYVPDTGTYYQATTLTLRAGQQLYGPGRIRLISGTTLISVPYGADNVTIDGIELYSTSSTYGAGTIVVGVSGGSAGNTTKNVSIQNCKITGQITCSRVDLFKLTNNRMPNSWVQFNDWYDRVSVQGNTIVHDNTILANGIGANSIDIGSSRHGGSIISNNIISVYRMGIEWRDRDGTTLVNNETRNICSNNEIRIYGSNVNSFGISLNSDGWDIIGNSIDRAVAANIGYGMEIVESKENVISGNSVVGFGDGIAVYSSDATKKASKNVVSANRVTKCRGGIVVYRYADDVTITGNYVEMVPTVAPSGATVCAIRADGDSSAIDGTYGRNANRIAITNNIIVSDSSATASNYTTVYARMAHDSIIEGNVINVSAGTQNSVALFIIDCDNLIVRSNRFVFGSGTPCYGISVQINSGRRMIIDGNSFSGFYKALENSGGNPFYSMQVSNNTQNNCTVAARIFPSSYTDLGNTLKTAAQTASPTLGTWNAGDVIYNISSGAGWKCTVSGTSGTLSSRTADTTNGSTTITVNNLENLEEGQYIAIAGVAGTKRINSINRNNRQIVIDVAANATVTGGAVSFVAATFAALPF